MAGTNGRGMDEKLQALKQGITTEMPSSDSVTVEKQQVTQANLLAQVTALAAPFEAADATHAVLAQQVAARDAALPATQQAYDKIVTAILSYVGKTNTAELAKYGIAPRKARRQLTGVEQVQAAAKAAATRKLRGTLGSKKKAAIQATGEVTVSTSLDAGSAAAPSSTSASSTSSPVNGSASANGSTAPAPASGDPGGQANGASH